MKCEVKHNCDMGMGHLKLNGWGIYQGHLWLNGLGIYDITGGAFTA